jgi:hypothetical protein
MLHKCANPTCRIPFRKLSQGKLFLVEIESADPANAGPMRTDGAAPRRIEHFWLCKDCAATFTLSLEPSRGVVTVPLTSAKKSGGIPPHYDGVPGGVSHP